MKKCSKCHKEKELSEFRKDKSHNDGYSSQCKDCRGETDFAQNMKEWRKKYRDENREHLLALRRKNRNRPEVKERQHIYYLKSRDHINEKNKEWRKNNPEKYKAIIKRSRVSSIGKARVKRYKERHKEEIKTYMREYRRKNKEIINRQNLNRHYLKKTNGEKISREQIENLKILQNNRCFYCGQELTKYHLDHVIPLKKGGEHRINNIVISCPHCNCSKKAMDSKEFINKILNKKVA